jgi:hypothetical protein
LYNGDSKHVQKFRRFLGSDFPKLKRVRGRREASSGRSQDQRGNLLEIRLSPKVVSDLTEREGSEEKEGEVREGVGVTLKYFEVEYFISNLYKQDPLILVTRAI